MAEPTIQARMQRRFILMTTDADMRARIREATPSHWTCVEATDLEALGSWNEVLLHRFLVIDLDEFDAFDPLDVIHVLRREHQINIPVFCFGGDEDIRDEMRLARADRFFSRDEMLEMLPRFFEQYQWGE
ncbi:hypothetical protein B1C78_09780 [Thioalkalivibrio denitrificans]|uniref:Response regulatory domain-containing protein n=1 Tax=Thioalkalivibrio denitrificans TaxID=108003 RepID=A0A1V3NFP0_9GAMM|nr:hypothetical protein [Thioalkalivibrio denitrificans]OOG23814.1 hypothetical protein B1C78_09780 [Thioalkalivibrio denitrificans]